MDIEDIVKSIKGSMEPSDPRSLLSELLCATIRAFVIAGIVPTKLQFMDMLRNNISLVRDINPVFMITITSDVKCISDIIDIEIDELIDNNSGDDIQSKSNEVQKRVLSLFHKRTQTDEQFSGMQEVKKKLSIEEQAKLALEEARLESVDVNSWEEAWEVE